MSAKSLNKVNRLNEADICIFDDHSDQYNTDFLLECYPSAKKIVTSDMNLGADKNSIKMLNYFIDNGYDWLFIADSDLVFNENIFDVIDNVIDIYIKNNFKGVVSLFNTYVHPMIEEIDELIGRKYEVGAAGVLMNKNIARFIIDNNDDSKHYDVNFSRVLKENNYDILCTNKSYVQHIGIEGYNSLYYTFDWGQKFESDNVENAKIIYSVLDQLMERIDSGSKIGVENRLLEDVKNKKIGIKGLIKSLIYSIKMKYLG